ncbi:hypothetical protein [[Clostridium] symbiosum]|nr:hypothetical protein [[Clostridium] symbiosum]
MKLVPPEGLRRWSDEDFRKFPEEAQTDSASIAIRFFLYALNMLENQQEKKDALCQSLAGLMTEKNSYLCFRNLSELY